MNSEARTQSTRIIFLGIDDTIRLETPAGMLLSADCVDAVRQLRRANDALLVVHSDWLRVCGRERTWDFLIAAGFEAGDFHRHWCLPVLLSALFGATGRRYEVLAKVMNQYAYADLRVASWMHFHPEVTNFVILDDPGSERLPRHREWVRYSPPALRFDPDAPGADLHVGPSFDGNDPAYRKHHGHWHVVDPATGFTLKDIPAAQRILSRAYAVPGSGVVAGHHP